MSAPRVQVYAARVVHLPPAQFAGRICAARLDALTHIGHPDAQAASLTGDLLLCAAVRRACPGAPMPVRRASAPGGKPWLPDHPALHISLSHSGGIVVCAAAAVPVGVDIELPRPVRPGLAARWFPPDEQALLARDPTAFFDLWMAKEAVLKEIGCGLAAGLRQVHVSLTPAPHLEAPVFGSMHALARAGLPGGLAAMVSVPGDTPPSLQVCPLTPANFL